MINVLLLNVALFFDTLIAVMSNNFQIIFSTQIVIACNLTYLRVGMSSNNFQRRRNIRTQAEKFENLLIALCVCAARWAGLESPHRPSIIARHASVQGPKTTAQTRGQTARGSKMPPGAPKRAPKRPRAIRRPAN